MLFYSRKRELGYLGCHTARPKAKGEFAKSNSHSYQLDFLAVDLDFDLANSTLAVDQAKQLCTFW